MSYIYLNILFLAVDKSFHDVPSCVLFCRVFGSCKYFPLLLLYFLLNIHLAFNSCDISKNQSFLEVLQNPKHVHGKCKTEHGTAFLAETFRPNFFERCPHVKS